MVPPADRKDPDGHKQPARDPPAILLVEDEVMIRLDTAEKLRAEGMTVIEGGCCGLG